MCAITSMGEMSAARTTRAAAEEPLAEEASFGRGRMAGFAGLVDRLFVVVVVEEVDE